MRARAGMGGVSTAQQSNNKKKKEKIQLIKIKNKKRTCVCVCRVLRLPWRVPAVAWAELSVLLLCVRDGRALFLVSPLLSPFPLFFFKPFSVEFFRFSGRSKENCEENISRKVLLRFFEFRAKFDFREKLIFSRRRVDLIKWIECCLWAPKLCFLVVVVVGRFTRQQQLLIWIFRRLVKIHNFFFYYFVDERILFRLVLFAVRSWVDQQPLERKKQLQLFLV